MLLGGGMTLDGLRADKEGLEGKKVIYLRDEHQAGKPRAVQRVAKAIHILGDRTAIPSSRREDELMVLLQFSLLEFHDLMN